MSLEGYGVRGLFKNNVDVRSNIGLDSYSRQVFRFKSVFESTAYLRFAKLQYVSIGFRCRVITGH